MLSTSRGEGDPICEFVRTPTGPKETGWHITEHDRLHHAKLQAEDVTTITYTFIGKGDDTYGDQGPGAASATISACENLTSRHERASATRPIIRICTRTELHRHARTGAERRDCALNARSGSITNCEHYLAIGEHRAPTRYVLRWVWWRERTRPGLPFGASLRRLRHMPWTVQ